MYRELLQDKPWKDYNSVIYENVDVEVIIFRDNDRNRRRRFRNTYAFDPQFQELLAKLSS